MGVEDTTPEQGADYWMRRALFAEEAFNNKRKWHLPPERQEFADLQKELAGARSVIDSLHRDIDVWKGRSQRGWDRVTELESEGTAAVLKRECEHWKHSWRNCTRRLGNCIEHLGLDHTGVEPVADSE